MLTYNLDIAGHSQWLHTTPGPAALSQPYYVTEAGIFYAGKQFLTSRTHKDSYLIFYTFSGEGFLALEGTQLRLTPGTALVLDCRQPQRYGCAPEADHWHHCWIHADGCGVAALAGIINAGAVPAVLPVPDTIRDVFDSLLRRVSRETADAVLASSLDIHRILQYIASSGLRKQAGANRSHQELMEIAADYIRDHYTEDLHIEALLSITNVSRSYFLRLFQKYMGTTPYNFLLRTRITRAKELLEMTDLPIALVGEQVGFRGETNFSARFSAIAGVTPGQYRKQAIGNR